MSGAGRLVVGGGVKVQPALKEQASSKAYDRARGAVCCEQLALLVFIFVFCVFFLIFF
jgi:hypothetical protein